MIRPSDSNAVSHCGHHYALYFNYRFPSAYYNLISSLFVCWRHRSDAMPPLCSAYKTPYLRRRRNSWLSRPRWAWTLGQVLFLPARPPADIETEVTIPTNCLRGCIYCSLYSDLLLLRPVCTTLIISSIILYFFIVLVLVI